MQETPHTELFHVRKVAESSQPGEAFPPPPIRSAREDTEARGYVVGQAMCPGHCASTAALLPPSEGGTHGTHRTKWTESLLSAHGKRTRALPQPFRI